MAIAERSKRDFQQQIPHPITVSTKALAIRYHAIRYPDKSLCAKGIDREIDKLDENGTTQWLTPAELAVLPEITRVIPMTLSLAYKQNAGGTI